jgi:predicted metal-dependent peptidase
MAKFNDAVTAVLLNQPFFGQLLMRMEHREDRTLPTAAVSKQAILYNPEYFDTLTEEQGIAAVTHELLHAVFEHLDDMGMYRDSGIGPDGKPYNDTKYNIAADYVINDLIRVNRIGTLHPHWMQDRKYTFEMTPAQVYCLMPDPPPGASSQDEHVVPDPDNTLPAAITPADIVQAAAAAASMGSMPQGFDRYIEALKKPTHSPWAILRKQVLSAVGGNDTSTWRRLQRRLITRRIGAPGRTSYGCGRLGVINDTSGSIDDATLALFGSHMGAILSDARPKEIVVYWCDAAVHCIDHLRTGSELRTLLSKPKGGGGGTDMRVGIEAALADQCEAVIVLTDGYTPYPDSCPVPLIWGMTTDRKAPIGKTVHLNP